MGFNNLQDSDWQNLIYLSLILTLLLSSLFLRRNVRYAVVFKYLAIWSAIGFVFVVLYSFRYEFSDFKNRILGEINPSYAKVGKHGELIINASQDGHFYIDVKVNGEDMRFMIDTGASEIVLSASQAKKVGIDLKTLNFNRVYQTANGTAFGASTILKEIEVGGIKFHDVHASVNNSEMGVSLLGMSFLRQFTRYEFYHDKLLLEI